jgi:hypothetical protein
MRKVIALAALAAALSTAAFAGDNKPVQMTDEQMDQVTAGAVVTGTPSTLLSVDNGHTTERVVAGSTLINGGPGGATAGNHGNDTFTFAQGGLNNGGIQGPGGSGVASTPGGFHGGCGPKPC